MDPLESAETFEVSSRQEPAGPDGRTVPVITVIGELDVATAPALREQLADLFGADSIRAVLDMTKVGFMDSTGLGVLVAGVRRLRESNGDLLLVIVNQHVLRVFAVTHLDQVFTIVPSTEAALQLARSHPSP